MSKEIKIQIDSREPIELLLKKAGAKYIGETTSEYLYFNQPEGYVHKLTKRNGETFETIIIKENNRFILKPEIKVTEPEARAKQLQRRYGIKRQLVNNRSHFEIENYEVTINDIENVGLFLIVEGNDPTANFVKNRLGIVKPKVITVSFDNL